MCGIVGYIGNNKKTIKVLIDGLEHLEYRGYDSAGIAYIEDKEIIIKKEKGRIANLKKTVDFNDLGKIGIGHTRWATHGEVNKNNSHPHNNGKITIVHNGIIENYLELKNKLIEKGYTFKSDTDTEVAAVLLDYLYKEKGNIVDSIISFKEMVKGAYALGIINEDNPDYLYAVKKNSPLIIGVGENENYIASDVPAIISETDKYITLEDGEFAVISKNNIDLYNVKNTKKELNIKEFKGTANSIDKNGYETFMKKEICEQPEAIKRLLDTDIPDLRGYNKVIIVACGSAYHAGLVGKSLIEEYGNIPVEVEIASEFRYKKNFIDIRTLVIAISQSGETADTLEAVKLSKKRGADTIGIINVEESSIAREVDSVVYTNAGPEIAVATTKGYSTQVEILSKIAYILATNNNCKNYKNHVRSFMSDLKELPIIMEEVLGKEEEYIEIAKDIYKKKDIFFIGRGIDYALSMEGSLKLKEISYIHSEAYPAGELKHGTISLIEDGTPVIGIVTEDNVCDKTISNMKEVKARGANVIYLTTDVLSKDGDFYNKRIEVPKVNPLLQPLVNILPLQLISYHVARLNKRDIDKPRNLAKSVTVE